MSAPSWANGPGLPTDAQRAARHALLPAVDPDTLPTPIPAPRAADQRIAETRAALKAARDAAVSAYTRGVAGGVTRDDLAVILEKIAGAQTALDGEAPRRRFAPVSGRPPIWANCGGRR